METKEWKSEKQIMSELQSENKQLKLLLNNIINAKNKAVDSHGVFEVLQEIDKAKKEINQ
jgi:hypothetical protein